MLKKIAVYGALGNMGQRYCRILDHLGVEHVDVDLGVMPSVRDCDGFIVATSTKSHIHLIEEIYYNHGSVPILCEKPLSVNENGIKDLWGLRKLRGLHLQMINQYKYLPLDYDHDSLTLYNYFKTGKDTLAWDCISILALAEGEVILQNHSPIWTCMINGGTAHLDDMDHAYIAMIEDWLRKPRADLDYIEHAHKQVVRYLNDKCPNRNTGKEWEY